MPLSSAPTGRAIAIVNPSAGGGRARRVWPEIRQTLQDARLSFHEVMTRSPREGMEIAAAAGADGYETVISVGGDGTTHWVVNGLMRSKTTPPPALAFIPEGTANELPRCLAIPFNARAAVQILRGGVRRRVDVGQVNDRFFATISGVGFDAEVAHLVNGWPRWVKGKTVYVAGILWTLATYRPVESQIILDGREQRVKLFLLAAANTNWYGGGMYMAPHARIDDGLLAVVYATDLSKLEALAVLPKVFSGRHLQHPKVAHMSVRDVRVESSSPLVVHADGEIVGRVPVTFRIVPHAIEVIVPARP
jgi:YegS/Rv2252/BmrU family lipid kinase